MKKPSMIVLVGNYGSGKTELSLNFALRAAQQGLRTVLADLDIINPYFRSSEQTTFLKNNNIRLVASDYVNTGVDLPIVPAQVFSIFEKECDVAVLDVGGDPVGARALGQYKDFFQANRDKIACYFVVNTCRPFANTTEKIMTLCGQISAASQLTIDGFINNTNVSSETTAQDIVLGQKLLLEVSSETNIPILYTTGYDTLLKEAEKITPLIGEVMPIQTYTKPSWL